MNRIILHSDMNSFYASVETMLHPELRGKAVAVCGSTENRHGIVLAKSQKAKAAGVKTGMANWQAKQACPGLIIVHPTYDKYMYYSCLAREIYYRYTDLVEPFGMDECWLDVSASRFAFGDGEQIAEEIRESVKSELGLTVSVGVSFNKIFAKLGSDMKKPDAVTVITEENFREKVWPLDVSEILYAGRSSSAKLYGRGIRTVGELACAEPRFIDALLGRNGLKLWTYANGLDNSAVAPRDYVNPVKSVGHGTTCTADLTTCEEVATVMLELSQDVGQRLRLHGFKACGVQISVRDSELCSRQYQCRLPYPTQNSADIANAARGLFLRNYLWPEDVRSVTVRAINLIAEETPFQESLFFDYEKIEKNSRLDRAVDELRRRFGKKIILPASVAAFGKFPDDGCEKVRMPSKMYA